MSLIYCWIFFLFTEHSENTIVACSCTYNRTMVNSLTGFFTKGAFCLFWLELKRKIPPMDYLPFRWTMGILRICQSKLVYKALPIL